MNKKLIIKLLISLILLGVLLWSVNISELINSLKNANIPLMLIVFSTCVQGTLVCTYKWMLLLRAQGIYKPGFTRLWGLYHIGMFFSNFLPTEVGGDVVRSYDVGKTSGKQTESLAAVAMERITGFSMVIFLAVVGLFLNWSLAYDLNLTYLIFGLLAASVLTIGLFSNRGFARWIKKIISFQSFQKGIEKLHSLYEAFYLYKRKNKVFLQTMGISLVFQLYTIWYLFALSRCLDINVSFIQMLLILPAITIISLIPISINAIGIREGAFVYIFTYIGISNEQSLALALVYRIGILIPGLVGGIIYVLTLINNKRKEIVVSVKR